jgi:DNA repair protein Crb2 Tudor domain
MEDAVVKCLVLPALVVLATSAPAQAPPKAGDVVWAEWQPNKWFHGKIARVEAKEFHIAFDDGDKAIVEAAKVAVDRTPKRELVAVVNTRVLAKFTKAKFYPGKVTGFSSNNFDIKFDDGDTDVVDLKDLRLLAK